MKRPTDEKIEDKLVEYRDALQDLKLEISEIRRDGYDTSILDLKVVEVEPQIKMARVTYEKKDIEKVQEKLDGIKKEMKTTKEGDPFKRIMDLIEQCFDDLRNDKKGDAISKWKDIQEIYRILPKDLQRTVFRACLELRRRCS
ncbi:MAG: hypothetical protein KJ709_00875 [Nanoarchaeota archaeon]|nr:hypothetical protein [Nanoarchaeota archaeon]